METELCKKVWSSCHLNENKENIDPFQRIYWNKYKNKIFEKSKIIFYRNNLAVEIKPKY